MPPPLRMPHPDTLAGTHKTGVNMYAELAACPLYANVRFIAPKGVLGSRQSFYAGWLINERRWARGRDVARLPEDLLAWAADALALDYSSVEAATGYSAADVEALRAEQAAKRAARDGALADLL